jgi:hypothetical protein
MGGKEKEREEEVRSWSRGQFDKILKERHVSWALLMVPLFRPSFKK